MDLEGTAAIVTGGASGLGAATARTLAARGAKVVIFDLDADLGTDLARAIGGRFQRVDVADEASVAQGLADAETAHGVARVLVNCAGIGSPTKTVGKDGAPHSLDVYRRVLEVNLVGAFSMLSKFAARLAAAEPIGEERGVIVNTASIAAYDGQVGQAAYASSKGGLVAMTLPIARDLAPLLIRVATIAPGLFLTPLLMSLPAAAQESLGRQPPHPNRLGRPEEYAMLVEAVIANPMLNGEVIRLDGALRMAPR